jgi:hypothetical protein
LVWRGLVRQARLSMARPGGVWRGLVWHGKDMFDYNQKGESER